MKISHPLVRASWTVAGELLSVPVFYVAWWLNQKALELPGTPNPPPFSAYAILTAKPTLLIIFTTVALLLTIPVVWLIRNRRRWRLLSACWIWGTGLWAPFLLVPLGKPQLFFHDSLVNDIVGVVFIAIITTLVPFLIGGLLAIGYWVVSLVLTPD